jgi:phage pi2 protein 07
MSKETMQKDLSNYGSILMGVPFRIANKDLTVWQKNERGLVIYFHSEDFWCNPPTDSTIESRAIKQIENHGIVYLPENYVEEYNRTGRAKDLEEAIEKHRQNLLKNKHLHPWMKEKSDLPSPNQNQQLEKPVDGSDV